MTTFYPNQPAPSFLKKYARNAYNRAQHDAHPHQYQDESAIDLQVRTFEGRRIFRKLFNQKFLQQEKSVKNKISRKKSCV